MGEGAGLGLEGGVVWMKVEVVMGVSWWKGAWLGEVGAWFR